MNSLSIEMLLSQRGAWPKGVPGNSQEALHRAALSKMIAADYMGFEHLRDLMLRLIKAQGLDEHELVAQHPEIAQLLFEMERVGLIQEQSFGGMTVDNRAKRYLSGGWLEELTWLAAREAGADEAIFNQVIGWEFQGYSGENEIDLIMRKSSRLALVSCKALKSELDINDRKLRNKLMDAVHETDNLADHFGRQGEKVALVVSTDLFDEVRNVPRYQALMGKAAVLDVRVIALEEITWVKLVEAMRGLLN